VAEERQQTHCRPAGPSEAPDAKDTGASRHSHASPPAQLDGRRARAVDGRGRGANGDRRASRSTDDQKGLPRGPQALPREEVAAHQRERLVTAMVQAVNERGVVATTISDIVTRAGISRRTFYEHFKNKEDCLLATYNTVVETEVQRLLNLAGPDQEWVEQLEGIIRALFDAIAERPDAARLICVEMGASGEMGVQHWADGATRFEHFIRAGFERAPGAGTIPDPVALAIVGALRKIIYTRVRENHSTKSLQAALARIVPELLDWITCYYPTPARDPPPAAAVQAAPSAGWARTGHPLATGTLGHAGTAAR
jgi:AcrR family transcriptional regulator